MNERCPWAGDDPLYQQYHDEEWGKPVYDERLLFEYINLEGMQAGLSWFTILKKRPTYRLAFAQFDPEIIAHYDEKKCIELMGNPGIIRHRLKIDAIINNAQILLRMRMQGLDLTEFLWRFVDGEPIINHWKQFNEVPAKTVISDKMSRELKKLGFKFVGSTTCYALMQAVGMVNDHLVACFCHGKTNETKNS
ncbi:MAG: DNA-3-methyladenine glycosylase [Legionella sp. 40-6]|nr:DNA-3-methyladenine glycosylase I [Legionella sp.]OJX98161.1 MAG: DNA-3-methyladenine glycosylase [Legionella sp. 40-6]